MTSRAARLGLQAQFGGSPAPRGPEQPGTTASVRAKGRNRFGEQHPAVVDATAV